MLPLTWLSLDHKRGILLGAQLHIDILLLLLDKGEQGDLVGGLHAYEDGLSGFNCYTSHGVIGHLDITELSERQRVES